MNSCLPQTRDESLQDKLEEIDISDDDPAAEETKLVESENVSDVKKNTAEEKVSLSSENNSLVGSSLDASPIMPGRKVEVSVPHHHHLVAEPKKEVCWPGSTLETLTCHVSLMFLIHKHGQRECDLHVSSLKQGLIRILNCVDP